MKTALFIDGANAYATAKALSIDMDYKRVLQHYGDDLVCAYYYTAVIEEDTDYQSIRPLIDWLDYNGYRVRTKPAKIFIDHQGRQKVKGNMDIEMCVDILDLCQSVEKIVVFTGDGDFTPTVHAAQKRGVRCEVVSSMVTKPSPMCADELRRAADRFIEMDTMREVFQRGREGLNPLRSRYGGKST